MKRHISLLLLLTLLSGCSWTKQALHRQAAGKSTSSIAIQGQVQGPAEVVFAKKFIAQEDGTIEAVADMQQPIAVFPIRAEDGSDLSVLCPEDSIQLCMELTRGEFIKVGGMLEQPSGERVVRATYVRRK